MIRNKRVLTGTTFMSMFFVGVGTVIIGAASRNIGLSPYEIGMLITVQNVGFIISVLVSGVLADTMRKPVLMFAASMILAVSFFFFYQLPSFFFNMILMCFIGLGMGAYEGVADAMLLDIHTERESFFISVNHFFVTLGELIITFYLIFLQMRWRNSMVQAAAAVLLVGILFGFSRAPESRGHIGKLRERVSFIRKQKGILLLVFTALCAVGAELGMVGILTTFLMDLRGFTQITSKLGLAVLLGGLACGRLLLGIVIKKERIGRNLVTLFGCTAAASAVLFFVPFGTVLTFLFLFLTGTALSILFPLIISFAGLRYKEVSGTVLGIIKLAVPLGGIILPVLMSVLSKFSGFAFSLLLFPGFVAVGFAALLAGSRRLRLFKPFLP